jgi:hypothetical protein
MYKTIGVHSYRSQHASDKNVMSFQIGPFRPQTNFPYYIHLLNRIIWSDSLFNIFQKSKVKLSRYRHAGAKGKRKLA